MKEEVPVARGKSLTLDEKIEKAQDTVFQAKDKYDAAVEELNGLLNKRKELRQKELLKAFETSPRSYEEIMKFLAGKSESDEE